MDIKGTVNSAITWPFMQEPLWRWFVFLIAIGFLMGAWSGVLGMLRGSRE